MLPKSSLLFILLSSLSITASEHALKTHQLNLSNCSICMHQYLATVAWPANSTYWGTANLTISPTLQHTKPWSHYTWDPLANFPGALSYLLEQLKVHQPATPPVTGVYSKVIIAPNSTFPFCVKSNSTNGPYLGEIPPNLCKSIIYICPNGRTWELEVASSGTKTQAQGHPRSGSPAFCRSPHYFLTARLDEAAAIFLNQSLINCQDKTQFCQNRPNPKFFLKTTTQQEECCKVDPSITGPFVNMTWQNKKPPGILFHDHPEAPSPPLSPLIAIRMSLSKIRLLAPEADPNQRTCGVGRGRGCITSVCGHLATLFFDVTLKTEEGLFFVCGNNTYLTLPSNWTGSCTLAYVSPSSTT
ncbi:syncytin-2-like [Choloepus didactylus]|uniref:syncytin-2-like n=1 Tax=Choloepus didactylus TaxID=27675 RepID=UPI00189CFE82|nr:syncytin-2-like [Choloepus didactylus]XP_037703612.1 syncytin-2-like [Choloepus didactylus]